MRSIFVCLILIALSFPGQQTQAQTGGLQQLENGSDARGWEAVGRLDIAGKGFCTGVLIAPDLVLTAAHCLFEAGSTTQIAPDRITFLAGLRSGRPEAERRIRKAVIHPDFEASDQTSTDMVRHDLALLRLELPIRSGRIDPFDVSNAMRRGTEIGIVSYARDRADAPSLQEICNVLGQQNGMLIMDCAVDFGASGAPVFRYEAGAPRLVSIVAAMAELNGDTVALGADLAAPLRVLRAELADAANRFDAPTGARAIRPGERSDTGARFVRP